MFLFSIIYRFLIYASFFISPTPFFPVSAANTEDKAGLNCPEFSRKTRENTLREFRTFRGSRQGIVQAQALALCSRKKSSHPLYFIRETKQYGCKFQYSNSCRISRLHSIDLLYKKQVLSMQCAMSYRVCFLYYTISRSLRSFSM